LLSIVVVPPYDEAVAWGLSLDVLELNVETVMPLSPRWREAADVLAAVLTRPATTPFLGATSGLVGSSDP
jgi:hypothetical protein